MSKFCVEDFVCTSEYDNLIHITSTNDRYQVLIHGMPGIGKTTLLRVFNYHNALKYGSKFIHAYSFFKEISTKSPKDMLLIDGLDEIVNPKEILDYLKINKYEKIVCTSRTTSLYNLNNFDYYTNIIELPPLTQEQMENLIQKKFYRLNMTTSNNYDITPAMKLIQKLRQQKPFEDMSVRDLSRIAIMFLSEDTDFYRENRNLLYQLGKGLEVSPNLIVPKNTIIVPSIDVVNKVIILNDSFLKRARNDPEIMYKLKPHEFEEMVCDLLEKNGLQVELTQRTHDGGKDIIAVQKSFAGNFPIYVECKRHAKDKPVSVSLIRELYGVMGDDDISAGLIVTTSYFSPKAIEFRNRHERRINLMDYNALVQALNNLEA